MVGFSAGDGGSLHKQLHHFVDVVDSQWLFLVPEGILISLPVDG